MAINSLKTEMRDCEKCKSHMAFLMAKMAYDDRRAELKHAYVISDEDGNIKCSNCGSGNCFDNYCGHCGAKLIGERKDEVEE